MSIVVQRFHCCQLLLCIMLMHLLLRFRVAMQSLSHSFVPLINVLTMCPCLGLVAHDKMSISTRYLKNSTHRLK